MGLNKVLKKEFNHTSYYFKKYGATSFTLANHIDSVDITVYFSCTFIIDVVLCILISWFLIIEEYRAKVTLSVVGLLFICLLIQNIRQVYSLRLGILLYWGGLAIPITFSCMYSFSSCKSVFWITALALWLVLCLAWRKRVYVTLPTSLPTTNLKQDFRIQANGEWLDNANWDIYIVKLPHKSKALVRQKNGEIKEYTVTDIAVSKTHSKL